MSQNTGLYLEGQVCWELISGRKASGISFLHPVLVSQNVFRFQKCGDRCSGFPSTGVQGLPSDSLPPCTLSPAGPPAVTDVKALKGASLTSQREFQAGHRPTFYRKMPLNHSSNSRCHQELTRNCHVPPSGKKLSLRRKRALVCLLIPKASFGAGEQQML